MENGNEVFLGKALQILNCNFKEKNKREMEVY